MSASTQIQARGKIIEAVDADAYRVELANGHRAIARAPKGTSGAAFRVGDTVSIEFHPYDLSRGWIILE